VPWQLVDDLERHGLTENDVATAAYWIDGDGRPQRGHRAVAFALQAAGGGWGLLGSLLLVPPISWLARAGYRLTARYRNRLPGGAPGCRMVASTAGSDRDRS
jgi:predicted DCC family thiol-disulfide oxidoreductase YuxK